MEETHLILLNDLVPQGEDGRGDLRIKNVQIWHEGRYTCTAQTVVDSDSAYADLKVVGQCCSALPPDLFAPLSFSASNNKNCSCPSRQLTSHQVLAVGNSYFDPVVVLLVWVTVNKTVRNPLCLYALFSRSARASRSDPGGRHWWHMGKAPVDKRSWSQQSHPLLHHPDQTLLGSERGWLEKCYHLWVCC